MGGRPLLAMVGLGLVAAAGGMVGAGAAPGGPVDRVQQPAPPASLRDGNLLANPGFEDGFSLHGAAELVVADGWTPWYDETQVRPEFKDEPYVRYRPDGGVQGFSLRVLHGVTLQKFFTFSGTHDAGTYQQVHVTPGDRLRVTVWVQTWSSDCDDPCVSPLERCRVDSTNSHGTYRVQAGIDPTGGVPDRLGLLPPGTVQWSDPPIVFEAYDRWFQLTVEAVAVADTVTVFTRGHPVWPVKHNDSYWDDARLVRVGAGSPTPSPTVASSPGPSDTPSSSATPRTPTPHTQVPPTPASRAFLPLAVKDHDLAAPAPSVTPPIGIHPTTTPTLSPEPPPSPTMAPEPTLAPTEAPSPTPGDGARCVRPVTNGDFETGDLAGWTAGPAGPAKPEVSAADVGPGGGDHSLRVGISAPLRDMGPSWSWAAQAVDLPADLVTATLRIAVRPESADTDGGDWQMVAVRDEAGAPLSLLYWQPGRSVAAWQNLDVALDPGAVAGRRIRVTAEAYNDGDGAPTALYLDNVVLEACRPAPAGGFGALGRGMRDPVPPGADIRIEFPIRYSPSQPNFEQPTCADLEFESVVVANAGGVAVSVGGWTLDDRDGNRYVFAPFVLGPGDRVRVWTKSGDDTTDGHFTDVYWNRLEPVWNNGGSATPWDEAVLRDEAGTEVARRGYP